jgi:hypothetical protein
MMRILNREYNYEVNFTVTATGEAHFYIKKEDKAYKLIPSLDYDEVEGLVDYLYSVVDHLDVGADLDSMATFKKIRLMEWKY